MRKYSSNLRSALSKTISIVTPLGTIEFTPKGELLEILEAQTPENRAKLEAHIADQFRHEPQRLMRFGFGSPALIDEILNPPSPEDPEDDLLAFTLARRGQDVTSAPPVPAEDKVLTQEDFVLH